LEVENLINQGIARFKEGKLGEQHTHTLRQSKKHQEFLRVKGGVINYLVDKFGDPIAVHERDVREAIMATTDRRDKRTVDAWLKIMFAKGLFREAAVTVLSYRMNLLTLIKRRNKRMKKLIEFYGHTKQEVGNANDLCL
jgi:hypothetical protein